MILYIIIFILLTYLSDKMEVRNILKTYRFSDDENSGLTPDQIYTIHSELMKRNSNDIVSLTQDLVKHMEKSKLKKTEGINRFVFNVFPEFDEYRNIYNRQMDLDRRTNQETFSAIVCRKCFSHNVKVVDEQNRGGDESSTIYASCNACGLKEKYAQ